MVPKVVRSPVPWASDGLALLWQIFGSAGFRNQFFSDSWMVGFIEGRPWRTRGWVGKSSLVLPELPLFLIIAVSRIWLCHLRIQWEVISLATTSTSITYYSKDHLVSQTYLGDERNNTPFFFIP